MRSAFTVKKNAAVFCTFLLLEKAFFDIYDNPRIKRVTLMINAVHLLRPNENHVVRMQRINGAFNNIVAVAAQKAEYFIIIMAVQNEPFARGVKLRVSDCKTIHI